MEKLNEKNLEKDMSAVSESRLKDVQNEALKAKLRVQGAGSLDTQEGQDTQDGEWHDTCIRIWHRASDFPLELGICTNSKIVFYCFVNLTVKIVVVLSGHELLLSDAA